MVFRDECKLCGIDLRRMDVTPEQSILLNTKGKKQYYPLCEKCYDCVLSKITEIKNG